MRAAHIKWTRRHPSPLHYFRVRPERRSRLYLGVEVYRTVGELRAATKADAIMDGKAAYRTRGLVAICIGHTERGRRSKRLRPVFATIRFTMRDLGTATITHEAFHATLRWAERRGIELSPKSLKYEPHSAEERMATAHEGICRGIVNNLFRVGALT